MNLSLPPLSTIIAALGYLGGVVGVILGSVNAGALTTPVRTVITAVSGLLVAITHFHTTAKAVSKPPNPPAA